MGFKKVPTIHTLTFEGTEYEGLEVRMKSTSVGKMRSMLTLLGGSDDEGDEGSSLAFVDSVIDMLVEYMVSWNMEEEDGTPIPADAEGLSDQELPFLLMLSERYLDQLTGPGPELGKGSPAGQQFPGQPPTMEAL